MHKMYTDAHNASEVNDRMALYKLKGCVKELNMFHNYESEKITLKPVTWQKTYNKRVLLFGSSARDRHARRI